MGEQANETNPNRRSVLISISKNLFGSSIAADQRNGGGLRMNNWWVNQNQTYGTEVPGGFLWSPKTNKNGGKNHFYDNMQVVRSGDLIFSFCDTKIKAVGVATGSAQTADKPNFGGAGDNWQKEGWLVPVEFAEVDTDVRPKDFIKELRSHLPERYSPLQSNGNGNQGVYLTAILRWSRLSEQILRVDKWSVCRG